MKTLLICHDGAVLDQEGLVRWLASFSDLVGMVVLQEKPEQVRRRIQREFKRVGFWRFLDVLAFRLYYKLVLAARDHRWEMTALEDIKRRYPSLAKNIPILYSYSPNTPEVQNFVEQYQPDILLARCKFILKESVFSIATHGTFVMHPGVCPEYRNAHGCFWALANRDLQKVGMTLLRIDKGVDTGPVYGYYTYPFDEVHESHYVIQNRVVLDNLDMIQAKLLDICSRSAQPLDTSGRSSGAWGQPWLSQYFKWKSTARRTNV